MAIASGIGSQVVLDYVSPSQLRRLRGREQAAAVCYRVGERGVEFLLVRTRGGRWTFPKGGIEPGLSYAQSAALEAFEEAGVHGRIEIASFARYVRRPRARSEGVVVLAYLCEVRRLGKPQESKRKRTWFSAEKAKCRLQERRSSECGAELAAVIDRAVSRVRRLHGESQGALRETRKDALQRVHFEAPQRIAARRTTTTMIVGRFRRELRSPLASHSSSFPSGEAVNEQLQRLLPGETVELSPPILRIGSDRPDARASATVATIDGKSAATSRKAKRAAANRS
ncbi:MAG: NUDIX domain-containing protein [Terriglobales bacterium]